MSFNPTFVKVKSVRECADLINKPHGDYPLLVDATETMIDFYLGETLEYITEMKFKSIHSYIMSGMPDMQAKHRGQWRKEVAFLQKSNGEIIMCTPPIMIEGEIEQARLFPMYFDDIQDDSDIIRWYRTFQIIHPFMDGNGRAGGVAAAIASWYHSGGEYLLAPCQ